MPLGIVWHWASHLQGPEFPSPFAGATNLFSPSIRAQQQTIHINWLWFRLEKIYKWRVYKIYLLKGQWLLTFRVWIVLCKAKEKCHWSRSLWKNSHPLYQGSALLEWRVSYCSSPSSFLEDIKVVPCNFRRIRRMNTWATHNLYSHYLSLGMSCVLWYSGCPAVLFTFLTSVLPPSRPHPRPWGLHITPPWFPWICLFQPSLG